MRYRYIWYVALAALKRYTIILLALVALATGSRYVLGGTAPLFVGPNCSEANQLLNCLNTLIQTLNPLISNGYLKVTPGTGFSYTFGNTQNNYIQVAPSGTLATGYFTLAPNPVDGARNCLFTTQIITAAYVSANAGQSVNGNLTGGSLSANTGQCYLYGAYNTQWGRG